MIINKYNFTKTIVCNLSTNKVKYRLMHEEQGPRMSNAFSEWLLTKNVSLEEEAMKQFEYVMNAVDGDNVKLSQIITSSYHTLGYFIDPRSFFIIFEAMHSTIVQKGGETLGVQFINGLLEMDDINAFSQTNIFLITDKVIRDKFWNAYFTCTDNYAQANLYDTASTSDDSNDDISVNDDTSSIKTYAFYIVIVVSLIGIVIITYNYLYNKYDIKNKQNETTITNSLEKEEQDSLHCVLENEYFYFKFTFQLVVMLLPPTLLLLYLFRYYYYYKIFKYATF